MRQIMILGFFILFSLFIVFSGTAESGCNLISGKQEIKIDVNFDISGLEIATTALEIVEAVVLECPEMELKWFFYTVSIPKVPLGKNETSGKADFVGIVNEIPKIVEEGIGKSGFIPKIIFHCPETIEQLPILDFRGTLESYAIWADSNSRIFISSDVCVECEDTIVVNSPIDTILEIPIEINGTIVSGLAFGEPPDTSGKGKLKLSGQIAGQTLDVVGEANAVGPIPSEDNGSLVNVGKEIRVRIPVNKGITEFTYQFRAEGSTLSTAKGVSPFGVVVASVNTAVSFPGTFHVGNFQGEMGQPLPTGIEIKSKETGLLYSITDKSSPSLITVPDLSGIRFSGKGNSVEAVLNIIGLNIGNVVEENNSLPKGTIFGQSLSSGTDVPKGSNINIMISKGQLVEVPDLADYNLQEAEIKLNDINLLSDIVYAPTNKYSEGKIITQSPSAGTKINTGSIVTFWVAVSSGNNNVTVPDVIGMTKEEAIAAFEQAGLSLDEDNIAVESNDNVDEGIIIRSTIEQGILVAPDTKIGIVISSGPSGGDITVTVPNLVGLTREEAEKILEEAGLLIDEENIDSEYSDTIDEGRITRTSIEEGVNVAKGSKIGIVISIGAEYPDNYIVVPNVLNLVEQVAVNQIESEGLTLGSITSRYSKSIDASRVIWQSISFGKKVEIGTVIDLIVSKGNIDLSNTEVGFSDVIIDAYYSGANPNHNDFYGNIDHQSALVVLGDNNEYLSLPTESYVIVGFTNNTIIDAPDQNDIFIKKEGNSNDRADVYVSSNNVDFIFLGTAGNAGKSSFDLSSISFKKPVTAVKIVGLDNSPGFNLVSVRAIEGAVGRPPVDLTVNITDIVVLLQVLANTYDYSSGWNLEQADVVKDGQANLKDVLAIFKSWTITNNDVEFSGIMDGIWTNPTPEGSSPLFDGIGTSYFTYGKGPNTGPNTLEWIGNTFFSFSDIPFKLGSIKYYNGATDAGTSANDVVLNLSLIINKPKSIEVIFPFKLELINVTNTDDPWESADYVYFPNTYPEQTIEIDSVLYKLELIGFSNDGEQSKVKEFHVLEGHRTSADLYGWITKVTESNLTHIEINGSVEILVGNSAIYTCNAFYDDGMIRNITEVASWSSNCEENCKISSNGIVTTLNNFASAHISISATYQDKISNFNINIIQKNIYYEDNDADGYGNPEIFKQAIIQPNGYVLDNTDCNDSDNSIYPDATEICNGEDDDCDGQIDEGLKSIFYLDSDNDGYGDPAYPKKSCSQPTGYVANSKDQCPSDKNKYIPGNCGCGISDSNYKTYYRDSDGDGYGNPAYPKKSCSQPTGYVTNSKDQCPSDKNKYIPGNCGCGISDSNYKTYYRDSDSDGYGCSSQTKKACSRPSGYVTNNSDCNCSDKAIYPGAPDLCDNKRNNCNSLKLKQVQLKRYWGPLDNWSTIDSAGSGYGFEKNIGYVYCETDGSLKEIRSCKAIYPDGSVDHYRRTNCSLGVTMPGTQVYDISSPSDRVFYLEKNSTKIRACWQMYYSNTFETNDSSCSYDCAVIKAECARLGISSSECECKEVGSGLEHLGL